jgi:hypothetical protein
MQTLPTRKYIIINHVETTGCKTVLSQTTFPIPSSLPFCCTRAAIDMSAINCTKGSFEEGIELWVVGDFGWHRFIIMRKFDMISVEWSRREDEHFEKISAMI